MLNTESNINVNKVAKWAKKTNQVIMFKCESGNLLITSQFIVSLTSEQFWKVQCKLELPERGIWYTWEEKNPVPVAGKKSLEELEQQYLQYLNQATEKLNVTYLTLNGVYNLYSGESGYTLINSIYLEMLECAKKKYRGNDIVVIDNLHVLSIAKDDIWKENYYIAR